GKPDDGFVHTTRQRGNRPGSSAVLRIFSAASGASVSACRPAVRRRTANAGDQPGADGQAEAAVAGRAVAPAVATAGASHRRNYPAHQPGTGRGDPAGGAERAHRAENRGLRLCAGGRAHRRAGSLRDIARARRYQGILPRSEGCRRSWTTAVEKETAMELSAT